MVQKYSEKGKCWSNYLKFCLDHDTLTIHDSLHVPEAEKKRCIQKLQKLVENQLLPSSGDTQCSEAAAVASPQQPQRTPTPSNFMCVCVSASGRLNASWSRVQ